MKIVSVLVLFLNAMTAFGRPQSSGGSSRGNLGVECKTEKSGDGHYKVNCEGANEDATLRSEHILWLQLPTGGESVVDIEIPNYKIAELIKAVFKYYETKGPQINVLLKKPEQTSDAQVGEDVKPQGGAPSVYVKYEPVDKSVVVFPNDKFYTPLSGPILPPPPDFGADKFRHGGNSTSISSNDNDE